MKFVKILILCICFIYAEAFHNFRMSERKKHNHIDDLKMRLINDKKLSKKSRPTTVVASKVEDNIPPYIRKYNRRFKSIYETMHKNPYEEDEKMRQYERNFRLERKRHNNSNEGNTVFGYFQKYKKIDDDQYRANEIPENEIVSKFSSKVSERRHKKHSKQHYHHSHHHKIKKLRTKPEAGIMQKKLKI